MALAKFIFLKSITTNKYLRYRKEDDSKHALLEFSQDEKEENAEIQYVKFEVQKSETMEGFVHIRNCYNNKFWVRKSGDEGSEWIAAEANEAEEDPSKGSCTLFKPVLVDGAVDGGAAGDVEEHKNHTTMEPQKIRLVHVDQLGQQGCVALADSDLLVLGDVDSRADDGVFLAYDATSSVVQLPGRVAFVGHSGEYAALTTVSGVTYMEFRTGDIGNAGVAHGLLQWPLLNPPYVTVENSSTSRWWKESGNYIVLTSATGVTGLRLTPIPLGGNNIALQDAFNTGSRFANCGAGNGMTHVLGRSATSISEYAIFRMGEPVLFRSISNMVYNLADARVYNVGSVDKFGDERRNNTSSEQTGTFGVEYSVTETRSWSDSISITTGISVSLSASIPYVGVSFGVELSEERNQTVTFGTEVSESRTISYEQGIIIPLGKKVTLLVVATRAQCDVPFTCNVVDIMTDGTRREYTKTDGLFKGSNEFSFDTLISEDDL